MLNSPNSAYMLKLCPIIPNYANQFLKDEQVECRKMPKKIRMHPVNGQNFQRTPKIARYPKSSLADAYHANSNAGIFGLTLPRGSCRSWLWRPGDRPAV